MPPPPSTLSPLPSLSVTNSAVADSGKKVACETGIVIIVTLAVVAIICGAILLIWNDDGTTPILRRLKMELIRIASTLIQWMGHYFSTTLLPAIQDLRRTAVGPQPPLRPPVVDGALIVPSLATPRPAMARDRNRIPLISYA